MAQFISGNFSCLLGPLSEMNVEAPIGNTIGGIRYQFSFLPPTISIFNGYDETILQVKRSTTKFFTAKMDFPVSMHAAQVANYIVGHAV